MSEALGKPTIRRMLIIYIHICTRSVSTSRHTYMCRCTSRLTLTSCFSVFVLLRRPVAKMSEALGGMSSPWDLRAAPSFKSPESLNRFRSQVGHASFSTPDSSHSALHSCSSPPTQLFTPNPAPSSSHSYFHNRLCTVSSSLQLFTPALHSSHPALHTQLFTPVFSQPTVYS